MALIDSLVSYWKLDEASGNALDAHGSNDLTETSGTIDAATGKVGGARDFEVGDTEFFAHADNADLSTGDIDFTWSAWVRLESTGANRVVFAKWDFTGQREYALFYNNAADRFEFDVSSNGQGSGATAVRADTLGAPSLATWYHLVGWHDSVNNQIGICANAGTADVAAHSTGVRDGSAGFALGSFLATGAGDSHWDGLIDEVGFWKRVLTSTERTALYNSGNGLAYPFTSGETVRLSRLALLGAA